MNPVVRKKPQPHDTVPRLDAVTLRSKRVKPKPRQPPRAKQVARVTGKRKVDISTSPPPSSPPATPEAKSDPKLIAAEINASLPTIREVVENSERAAQEAEYAREEAVELGARVVLPTMWVKYCRLRQFDRKAVIVAIKDETKGTITVAPQAKCHFELIVLKLAYGDKRHVRSKLTKMSQAFRQAFDLGTPATAEAWTNLIESTTGGYQALAQAWAKANKKGRGSADESEETEDGEDGGEDGDAGSGSDDLAVLEAEIAALQPISGVFTLAENAPDPFQDRHYGGRYMTIQVRLTTRRQLEIMAIDRGQSLRATKMAIKRNREFA